MTPRLTPERIRELLAQGRAAAAQMRKELQRSLRVTDEQRRRRLR